ncbi:MAG: hypothetical protein U9O82_12910 [Thermodesulfobacteriota bacterium]|nr:hypothetical protein [Thermodesulfobacteriota bacterium]
MDKLVCPCNSLFVYARECLFVQKRGMNKKFVRTKDIARSNMTRTNEFVHATPSSVDQE